MNRASYSERFLVTGGAGFIGINYVKRLLARGANVTILDNFSRPGSRLNLAQVTRDYPPSAISVIEGDIRNRDTVEAAIREKDVILHLAGQVTVTHSVSNPFEDFNINSLGTVNVLEAARALKNPPFIIYASTNKVYGSLQGTSIIEKEKRYEFVDRPHGIDESQILEFYSPYGCSKGAADQYVCDYFRIFGIPTVVLRQSAIYGPHQFGIEDQGWLAWFLISALFGRKVTIFGTGKQVRDALYIDDLLDVFDACVEKSGDVSGHVFNIGGGIDNTISIWWEFKDFISEIVEYDLPAEFASSRPGDQPVYISDLRKAQRMLDWRPSTDLKTGITALSRWISSEKESLKAVLKF
jgi:CDP-paratose 2-epimerase